MKDINGIDAMRLAKEVSKLPNGNFSIVFFKYNRTKGYASSEPQVMHKCVARTQLPIDEFSISSDNFFLFSDEYGNPKMCYRWLIRYIGFPHDNYRLRKVIWT